MCEVNACRRGYTQTMKIRSRRMRCLSKNLKCANRKMTPMIFSIHVIFLYNIKPIYIYVTSVTVVLESNYDIP
jgi:hypothetical protein